MMPKRKRDEEAPKTSLHDVEDSSTVGIRKNRLKAKTARGRKELHDALKLARGFERQKLGRRQKTAMKQKNQKELQRLRDEVAALKALELTKVAQNHLMKQYVRTKRIRESPAFVALFGADGHKVEPPKTNAEANVIARLFKSAPVTQVLPGIMAGLLACLGLEDFSTIKAAKADKTKQRKASKDKDQGMVNGKHGEGQAEDDQEFRGFSSDDNERADLANGSLEDETLSDMDIDDAVLDQFDARLGSSSDSEADGASDSFLPDLNIALDTKSNQDGAYLKARDLSLSPSPSISRSRSPSPPPQSKSKPTAKPSITSTTTFLPSLTMGGYFSGGSDSDSDFDNPNIKPLADPRKNRRGQRARQLIAERKYGKKANHLKKEQEDDQRGGRGGWDPRRGAVNSRDDGRTRRNGANRKPAVQSAFEKSGAGRQGRTNGKPVGRGPKSSGANEESLGRSRVLGAPQDGRKKIDRDNSSLHPSWEAAKRRKEEKTIRKFEGKKITFD